MAGAVAIETLRRGDFRHFLRIPTRWMDNDVYGHVNNVQYYSFFDTVINKYLIEEGGLDISDREGGVIGLAVHSSCSFKREITFPEDVEACLRVGHVGNTSARYEVGLFTANHDAPAAFGDFVHVFVDRLSHTPTPIPPRLRSALQAIATSSTTPPSSKL